MKNRVITCGLLLASALSWFIMQPSWAQFQYINPKPGSIYRNPQTAILLRGYEEVDPASLQTKDLIILTGSESGRHSYTIQLARDRKSIIITPEIKFRCDEKVQVQVSRGITTMSGNVLDDTTFSFRTSKKHSAEELKRIEVARKADEYEMPGKPYSTEKLRDSPPAFSLNVDTTKVFEGSFFFGNKYNLTSAIDKFLCILNNDGTYTWTKNVGDDGVNFKLDKNGFITYFRLKIFKWYMIDSNYNVVDSFQCKNGYELETNYHEFQHYPDGHKFLLAYHNEIVDLSQYGGFPNAIVKFPVIQEQDADENVVFEWLSSDYFQLTDATYDVNFTTSDVDPYHTNAIELDYDGNILICSRYMDEVTKINHQTGEIMWRMGGENNQFTFVNDPLSPPFSHQHDIRRLPNGNVTLFDNGNLRSPQVSYVKEYSLDEINKIATLVWSYKHPPVGGKEVFSLAQGNSQRLPNGNTLINYAQLSDFNSGLPSATEVTSDGDIASEIIFTENQTLCYRMHKYEWNPCARPSDYTLKATSFGPANELLSWGPATGAVQYVIKLRISGSSEWQTLKTETTRKMVNDLQPGTLYEWRIKSLCAGKMHSAFSAIHTFQTSLKEASDEYIDDSVLEIFPNPAVETINLRFQFDSSQQSLITIVDSYGREVYNSIHQLQEGVNLVELNVTSLPGGMYYLKIGEARMIQKVLVNP